MEAKQLSETVKDVVARAASCILGGDPKQGFFVESCVIATCVVLHERHRGLLSCASCAEQPNAVLLEWLQHRAQSRVDRGACSFRAAA